MKRFAILLLAVLLSAACSKSDPAGSDGPQDPPQVTTAAVTESEGFTVALGGSVTGVEVSALTEVGVQYIEHAPGSGSVSEWDGAFVRTTRPAAVWSIPVQGLTPAGEYAVRAFVKVGEDAYFGEEVLFTATNVPLPCCFVLTADVTDFDATSAVLGGWVENIDVSSITAAGVEYALWKENTPIADTDWTRAVELLAEPGASWSVRATGLTAGTNYLVRAFAEVGGIREYGDPKPWCTPSEPDMLTVAQLRAKHAAGEDVSGLRVRGYVALSVPYDDTDESFDAGTVILYDNTGVPASALILSGGASAEGIGAAGLQAGDQIEVTLAGAEREYYQELIPRYTGIGREAVRVAGRGHVIDPVWATPAELASRAGEYACSPVQVHRVYAETPGVPFSTEYNWFTDGLSRITVWAREGSEVGSLVQNSATGTLSGICFYYHAIQVIPVKTSDVAGFTGEDGIAEGEPSIELLNTEYYEFPPQGGTRIVDMKVTAPASMRLYADTRNIDESRYCVDIAGSRVRITARANTTGRTEDYSRCYLYLAESKDGQRYVPQTLRVTQLSSVYESIPSLIQANGGELSSVHEAVVNDVPVKALKLGSGKYAGHYTSDPVCVAGDCRLVFYAVGWTEADHAAGTLYLRVRGGGEAAVGSVPLVLNDGATGQAPFILHVDEGYRHEVALTGLEPGSVLEFSTSPAFDKRKDDYTGRALLFGVQLAD